MSPFWTLIATIFVLTLGNPSSADTVSLYNTGWDLYVPVIRQIPEAEQMTSQPVDEMNPQFVLNVPTLALASSSSQAISGVPGSSELKSSASSGVNSQIPGAKAASQSFGYGLFSNAYSSSQAGINYA